MSSDRRKKYQAQKAKILVKQKKDEEIKIANIAKDFAPRLKKNIAKTGVNVTRVGSKNTYGELIKRVLAHSTLTMDLAEIVVQYCGVVLSYPSFSKWCPFRSNIATMSTKNILSWSLRIISKSDVRPVVERWSNFPNKRGKKIPSKKLGMLEIVRMQKDPKFFSMDFVFTCLEGQESSRNLLLNKYNSIQIEIPSLFYVIFEQPSNDQITFRNRSPPRFGQTINFVAVEDPCSFCCRLSLTNILD